MSTLSLSTSVETLRALDESDPDYDRARELLDDLRRVQSGEIDRIAGAAIARQAIRLAESIQARESIRKFFREIPTAFSDVKSVCEYLAEATGYSISVRKPQTSVLDDLEGLFEDSDSNSE